MAWQVPALTGSLTIPLYSTTPPITPLAPTPHRLHTHTTPRAIATMAAGDLHHPTPKKAKVLGTVAYLESHKATFFKSDVFRHFQVSNRRGWQILHDGRERRHLEVETRGRKHIISAEDLQHMEKIIWQFGFQARALTWQGLAIEAGIYTSARTVERAMGTFGYRKCIACEKGFVSPSNAKRRV